ncbi:LysR family transcriptional regulator [Ligilactobacillus faecis]|uniref:LysR family transcriptional regulator n=1 Tax=Ligilactobacillus faecis TaxID=762833 RepID=UPI00246870A1|nr:LysR family transcriptional regulator [Ligilactobacillus faecis]WGN89875.1 LysR family transcriptional regulator [Ligilactobacillus faecis]
METRVLNYFLMVAKLGNVTRAAENLHITQPTLSRQIADLEAELGVKLFDRTKRHLTLTKAGTIFQQRAMMILDLIDQTEVELSQEQDELTGTIHLGCVESNASSFMMKLVTQFQEKFPNVHFDIYTGNGDILKERLDQGLLEVALLIEPIETAKYNYLVLPTKDTWGVLMRSADPLAKKGALTREALYKLPLIIPHRNLVRDELTDILKIAPSKLNTLVESNLSSNALQLVKYGHYYLLGIKGVYELHNDPEITFLPFSPLKQTGHVLAWRKNALLSPVTQKFIQFVTDASNI